MYGGDVIMDICKQIDAWNYELVDDTMMDVWWDGINVNMQ